LGFVTHQQAFLDLFVFRQWDRQHLTCSIQVFYWRKRWNNVGRVCFYNTSLLI